MELPAGCIASISGEPFCFLVDVVSTLSSTSGFLFFESAAWACLSCKLRDAASGGVDTGPCVLDV